MNSEYLRYITLKCQLLKNKKSWNWKNKKPYWSPFATCMWAFLSIIHQIFLQVFSPFWGENFFVSLGGSHHHFSLSPSLPNTFQEVFFPYFLSFFFILPKIHSTKHTLKLQCSFLKLFFVNLIITTMRTSGFHFQKHALRF